MLWEAFSQTPTVKLVDSFCIIFEESLQKIGYNISNIFTKRRSKMPFSNIPVKNPGRYLEQFVKIVQPRGGDSMGTTAREGMASRYLVLSILYTDILYCSHAQTWKSSSACGEGHTSNTYQAADKQNNNWKQWVWEELLVLIRSHFVATFASLLYF